LICDAKYEQELDRSLASFVAIYFAIFPGEARLSNLQSGQKSRFLSAGQVLNCENMSSAPKKTEPPLNFEGAMDRLEEIVEQMESGKMMLEELIVRYEEGMKLVKICQERLASAEQRIEIITRNNAGKPVVKEFEPAPEKEPSPRPDEKGPTKNDDVSLF
jgi:exodeoxyribonuclease VII small subunit